MARLRQILTILGVAAVLGACGPAPSPGNTGPARPAAGASPAPVAAQATEAAPAGLQSRIPELAPAQVKDSLRQAAQALERGQVEQGASPGPGALELYLAVLAIEPGNAQAQAGVHATVDALLERGRLAMRSGDLDGAARIEQIAGSLVAGHPDLPGYRARLAQAREAGDWVAKADQAGKSGRITEPAGDSVIDFLDRAGKVFADFGPARASRDRWNRDILKRAWGLADKGDFAAADALLLASERLAPASAAARVDGLRIVELRQQRTDAALAAGNEAVDRLQLDRADAALADAAKIAAQSGGVDALRQRIFLARHYGPFKPGQAFADKLGSGAPAPEMVVIPFGKFVMGSSDEEPQRQDNELPAHEVDFARGFAIARNEITVADFRQFVEATRYRSLATRLGHSTVYDEKGGVFSEHSGVDWRRDHVGRIASPALPVVHIALEDAAAYARWLSQQTGQRYRLPSEAQFEYVLRAGSTTLYPWGSSVPTRIIGNLPGDGDLSRSGRKWSNAISGYRDAFWGPAPVRNFPVEMFGTFDMIGNVSEWTLDCWHDSYQRAPADGSAWVNPGCRQRVVRGASWGSAMDQARSAYRQSTDAETTSARLGFRVVREL